MIKKKYARNSLRSLYKDFKKLLVKKEGNKMSIKLRFTSVYRIKLTQKNIRGVSFATRFFSRHDTSEVIVRATSIESDLRPVNVEPIL